MTFSIADVEALGLKIIQSVEDHEGVINTIAGMAGVLPEVSMAEKMLPGIAGVFQFMQQETGKSLLTVVEDWINHAIIPTGALSPVLSLPADATTTAPRVGE
jgi:hypothetical protein